MNSLQLYCNIKKNLEQAYESITFYPEQTHQHTNPPTADLFQLLAGMQNSVLS